MCCDDARAQHSRTNVSNRIARTYASTHSASQRAHTHTHSHKKNRLELDNYCLSFALTRFAAPSVLVRLHERMTSLACEYNQYR